MSVTNQDHDANRFGDVYSSTQSIIAQENEYDEACWDENDEEWYNVHEFAEFIHDRTIHWDWGGIARIRVAGQDTNYHVGIWMLRKEDAASIPITLQELVKFEQEVLVEWVNK